MPAYINRKEISTTGISVSRWIPLNRYAPSNYTIMTKVTGTATYTIESTIDPLNWTRRNTDILACPVENATDLTTNKCLNITETPLEGIRVNQTLGDGTVEIRVMQNGS